jgi:hypothetical protein
VGTVFGWVRLDYVESIGLASSAHGDIHHSRSVVPVVREWTISAVVPWPLWPVIAYP